MAHAFNPTNWEAEAGQKGLFNRDLVSKTQKEQQKSHLTIRSQACLPSMNPLGIALGVRISYLEKDRGETMAGSPQI